MLGTGNDRMAGSTIGVVVDGGAYDVRREAAGPGQRHGPGQHAGDPCVVVLQGGVRFMVDGAEHALEVHDLLWVPAGAWRGFVAGEQGVVLLAIHLPRSVAAARTYAGA